jgi:ribonuclease Z
MFVIFLGTGNALPAVDRANTSLALLAAPQARAVLIDCGGDPYRGLLRVGLETEKISDIIITHAHIDHLGGLPSLIESFRIANRKSPLTIYANAFSRRVIDALLTAFSFELTLNEWPFSVIIKDFCPGNTQIIGDFTITAMETEHSVPSMGLRVSVTNLPQSPIFAYTSDTRDCPQLSRIAANADFFIAEATYLRGNEDAARVVSHMTVAQAAEFAKCGQSRSLGLVHLTVNHNEEHKVLREARSVFGGHVIIPRDGTIVEITQRHVKTVRHID